MNHLQRFENSIHRRNFDRLPSFFSATPEMTEDLEKYMGKDIKAILHEDFNIDYKAIYEILYIGPKPKIYDDGSYDSIFGVRMRNVSYGRGTYSESIQFPLVNTTTVHEVENYTWPRAEDHNYEYVKEVLEQYPDQALSLGYIAIGWFSWEMRGMSQFLVDLLLDPELAEAIIQKVSDYGMEYYRRIIEAGKDSIGKNFFVIHLSDDWATQDSLMISPRLYKDFFKRHYRRIIDMAHSAGLLVEFHCCGSVVDLIPELIDTGIDILNPIQTSAKGMDAKFLKREYGKHITFSGGVDVQTILPFGTPEKVKDEVKFLIETLGDKGGYLIGPSHSIQVGTPPENVIALYEAVHEYFGAK